MWNSVRTPGWYWPNRFASWQPLYYRKMFLGPFSHVYDASFHFVGEISFRFSWFFVNGGSQCYADRQDCITTIDQFEGRAFSRVLFAAVVSEHNVWENLVSIFVLLVKIHRNIAAHFISLILNLRHSTKNSFLIKMTEKEHSFICIHIYFNWYCTMCHFLIGRSQKRNGETLKKISRLVLIRMFEFWIQFYIRLIQNNLFWTRRIRIQKFCFDDLPYCKVLLSGHQNSFVPLLQI